MEYQPSPPSDSVRTSLKLQRYLPALEDALDAIKVIQDTQVQGNANGLDFTKILQELLPSLAKAFKSDIAFCTDMTGTVSFAAPEHDIKINERFLSSPRVRELLETGKPLIIVGDNKNHPESDALGVQSLLAVRFLVPGRTYLVGVCNGHDDPPYEAVDKKLLETLADILGLGMKYGHTQAETRLAYDRYLHAQRSGRYNFLSRASEDCARFVLNLKVEGSESTEGAQPKPDDLLADYLDAELCKCMQDSDPQSEDNTIGEGASGKAKAADYLLSLIQPSNDQQKFAVVLNDNKAPTSLLKPDQYPRTALAIARISLWTGYMKAGAKLPDWIDENEREQRSNSIWQGWNKADAAAIFYAFPQGLIRAARPNQEVVRKPHLLQWQFDWLRTLWQKIYYIARDGIVEPHSEWIKEIDSIYYQARPLTAQVLRSYLHKYVSDGCLAVDSDWLVVWLTSNVLLSKHLAERYGMEPVINGEELLCSPTEKMRYFTHLSHLVLYTLHCARHSQREKEVRKKIKREVVVQRLPFAEVPIDSSLGLSEAQLYILSEYAYHEIGVPRELVLFERLGRQLHFELPLYAASNLYRDHLYHVIDVCLLGELLLRSKISSRRDIDSDRSLVSTFANNIMPPEKLMRNWYVAALYHDLGYVVERAGNILEPVHSINGPGLNEFWKDATNGLDRGGKKIKQAVDAKLTSAPAVFAVTPDDLRKVKPTDHSIASWLHLNQCLDQIGVPPQELSHALSAILRHNLPEQRVGVDREPLTLLLMLCDHLQEWGRPRVESSRLARGVLESLRFTNQPDLDPKIRVRQLLIRGLSIDTKDPGNFDSPDCNQCWRVNKWCPDHCFRVQTCFEHKEVEFELSYLEARESDFEPVISWLLLCRNMQCFSGQSEALPFDIKITLKHTPSRIWHSLPWRPLEMDLIQEFANEYEPAIYLCEWIKKARRGDDGIHYTGDRGNGLETFTIHLNQLCHPLQRGLSDEHWKQFFKWKWQRLGQRFIQLKLGTWFPEL